MGELLDDLVERLPHRPEARETSTGIRVAIVGRPNVGKSSLVNAIVGADRVIVDEVPGTTRDSVDTPFSFEGHHFVLIDTAGMRRKARVKGRVEFYSNLRALRSIERCQVGVLVVDAAGGIAEQDARIGSGLEGMSKGVIIVLNKIDLVPPEKLSTIEAEVQRELSFLDYAPLGRVSALKGEGIRPLLRKVIEVRDIMQKKVLDEEAEAVLEDALKRNPAPSTRRGRAQTFYSAVQKGGRGGTFVIACTDPESIPESYIRYLRNRFRSAFGFAGVGVRVVLRRGGKRG
jgi:GTP-binding protein